jgi:CHAD domain-containing protein
MSTIQLSENQKQLLVEYSQDGPELLKHRARLVLAYGEGKPTMQAALEAGISRGRARYWKREFISRGMGIFNLDTEQSLPKGPVKQATIESPSEMKFINPSENNVKDLEAETEKIQYPLPQNTVGVTEDDSLVEAGRKIWLYHFAIMVSHEQGTLLGEDIEELHDMRVATRRMRSAFDIFSPAFNPKVMKRYLKGLKKIGRVLGQVRDMDVILQNGLIYQRKLSEIEQPGIDPLLAEWKQVIDTERMMLIKHLQSVEYERFKEDFNRFLQAGARDQSAIDQGNEGISKVRDIVPILIYSRYASVRAYETIVPTASINQLHELRIEFKKFRYTLEYFKEILNESVSKTINEIKQYQDHLGELHDADVACQLVKGFLKKWEANQQRSPIQDRINPEPIVIYIAYLHSERYRLMTTFPDLWQNINRTEFRQNLAKAISLL